MNKEPELPDFAKELEIVQALNRLIGTPRPKVTDKQENEEPEPQKQ